MKRLLLLLTAFVAAAPMSAQTPPPPPEARQFDFWLGEWDVSAPDGKPVGTSRIESVAGGWGLLEHWTGAGGATGRSLNTWFPAKRQWQQFWVGNGGGLELAGGLNARGEMVLVGTTPLASGAVQHERITWTPNADGTVRQLWEQSKDGVAWTTAFDGLYRRKRP